MTQRTLSEVLLRLSHDGHPEVQCLMLTSFADDEALFASIMAGAAGYVLKQIRGGELVRAIREVGAGKSLLDPEVTKSVLERLPAEQQILEYSCLEGERSLQHYTDEDGGKKRRQQ